VELGVRGALVRRGSQKPLEEVEQVILVIDHRFDMYRFWYWDLEASEMKHHRQTFTDEIMAKTLLFFLLPSFKSSPTALVGLEAGLWGIAGCHYWLVGVAKEVYALRIDEFLSHGDSVVRQMVEQGKRVCPSESAEDMLGMFYPYDALKFYERSLWETCWSYCGFDTGIIYEFQDQLGSDALVKTLQDTSVAMPLSDLKAPKVPPVPRGAYDSPKRPLFVAFSEAVAFQCTERFETPVHWFGKEQVDHLRTFAEKSEETEGKAPVPDEFKDVVSTYVYPVLVIDIANLTLEQVKPEGLISSFLDLFGRVCTSQTIDYAFQALVVSKDYASFACNEALIQAIPLLRDNYANLIFVTQAEAVAAAAFFTKAQSPTADMGRVVNTSSAWSNLNMYTLSTALGQSLEDREIIQPVVTLGGDGLSGIPKEKFHPKFIVADREGNLLTERSIPGAAGCPKVSIIQPSRLLRKLLCAVSGSLPQEPSDELKDASSTVKDLVWEYNSWTKEQTEE